MIHFMKYTLFSNGVPQAALVLILTAGMSGAATTLYSLKTEGRDIPDSDGSGIASLLTLSTGGERIGSMEVGLDIAGGWNSDYYAYLQNGSGVGSLIVILLNRPGVSAADPGGAASSGMSLILADSAPLDIHTGIPMNNGDVVAGRYQPDGRTEDPLTVTDTSPRTTFLADFNGAAADGDWTLFIADQGGGEVGQLTSWSLNMTFAEVPEPSAAVSVLLALGAGLGRRRR